jgi:hypothetical protein
MVEGARKLYEATAFEPAEYELVRWGTAKQPKPEQRVIRINGDLIQLSSDRWDCDGCNRPINPGDRACARTIWRDDEHQSGDPEYQVFADGEQVYELTDPGWDLAGWVQGYLEPHVADSKSDKS